MSLFRLRYDFSDAIGLMNCSAFIHTEHTLVIRLFVATATLCENLPANSDRPMWHTNPVCLTRIIRFDYEFLGLFSYPLGCKPCHAGVSWMNQRLGSTSASRKALFNVSVCCIPTCLRTAKLCDESDI